MRIDFRFLWFSKVKLFLFQLNILYNNSKSPQFEAQTFILLSSFFLRISTYSSSDPPSDPSTMVDFKTTRSAFQQQVSTVAVEPAKDHAPPLPLRGKWSSPNGFSINSFTTYDVQHRAVQGAFKPLQFLSPVSLERAFVQNFATAYNAWTINTSLP